MASPSRSLLKLRKFRKGISICLEEIYTYMYVYIHKIANRFLIMLLFKGLSILTSRVLDPDISDIYISDYQYGKDKKIMISC